MLKTIITKDERARRDLFRSASDRIGRVWESNTEERLRQMGQGEAVKALEISQEALNKVWLASLGDMMTIDEFKKALNEWERIRLKASDLLKKIESKAEKIV